MNSLVELKGVMTRDELLTKTSVLDASAPLDIVLSDEIEFKYGTDGEVTVRHDKGETILSHAALSDMLVHTGFPKAYLKKLPVDRRKTFVGPHLDYWYREALGGRILRLMTIDNTAIQAVPRANFEHIPLSKVVESIETVLGDSIQGYHKVSIKPSAFQFSVLLPFEVEIGEKDKYNAGIRITHSVIGQHDTKVSPYVFRQWCSNGATSEFQFENSAMKRRGGHEDISDWLQRAIIGSEDLFRQEVLNLKGLQKIKLDSHTSEVLDSVLSSSSIPAKLQIAVRNAIIDEPSETLLDIYNILTKVDTHDSTFVENPGQQGLLSSVAAHLSQHSELCPVCHKARE